MTCGAVLRVNSSAGATHAGRSTPNRHGHTTQHAHNSSSQCKGARGAEQHACLRGDGIQAGLHGWRQALVMYAGVMHVATELHTWQQQLVTGVHQGAKVGPHFARLQHNHPLQAAASPHPAGRPPAAAPAPQPRHTAAPTGCAAPAAAPGCRQWSAGGMLAGRHTTKGRRRRRRCD